MCWQGKACFQGRSSSEENRLKTGSLPQCADHNRSCRQILLARGCQILKKNCLLFPFRFHRSRKYNNIIGRWKRARIFFFCFCLFVVCCFLFFIFFLSFSERFEVAFDVGCFFLVFHGVTSQAFCHAWPMSICVYTFYLTLAFPAPLWKRRLSH